MKELEEHTEEMDSSRGVERHPTLRKGAKDGAPGTLSFPLLDYADGAEAD